VVCAIWQSRQSCDKRIAILGAAVHEIAETGLAASTAKIAGRAAVATGTLFTCFAHLPPLHPLTPFQGEVSQYLRRPVRA